MNLGAVNTGEAVTGGVSGKDLYRIVRLRALGRPPPPYFDPDSPHTSGQIRAAT